MFSNVTFGNLVFTVDMRSSFMSKDKDWNNCKIRCGTKYFVHVLRYECRFPSCGQKWKCSILLSKQSNQVFFNFTSRKNIRNLQRRVNMPVLNFILNT